MASAQDDGKDGVGGNPSGCYLKAAHNFPGAYRYLNYNMAGTNTGPCTPTEICICARNSSALEGPSTVVSNAEVIVNGTSDAAGSGGYTHPEQCGELSCCAVIYKYARGFQCHPVPICTRPSEAHTMHMHVHALHVHMGFYVYERTVYQPSLRKLRDLPCHVHIPVHST